MPPAPAAEEPRLPPRKDSVELLLEGMAEQSLARPKTTPQTDGQASASYHAEHRIHGPARQLPDDGPKVQLDRPTTPTAVRTARAAKGRALEGMDANTADQTVAPPSDVTRRVLLALFAGIVVVCAIFAVLWWAVPRMGSAPIDHGTVSVPAVPHDVPVVPMSAAIPDVAPTAVAPPPPLPSDSTPASASAAPTPPQAPTPVAPPRRRTKPPGTATSGAHDWGEFKTTY